MKVYTYSQARQRLASLLDEASRDGSVRIRRRDGGLFEVAPVAPTKSALDVAGLPTDISRREIVSVVRESRRRSIARGLPNKRMQPSSRARRVPRGRVRSRAARS